MTGRRCCWCGPYSGTVCCTTFAIYSCVRVDFSYPYDVICLIFHVILVTYSVILGGSNVLIFDEFITTLASEQIDRSHVILCFTDITFLDNWIATLCCAFADLSAPFSCWNSVHGPPSRTLNCHSAGCLMINLNLCSDLMLHICSFPREPHETSGAGFFSLGTYALVYE
jgi:hypothetical protein